MKNPVCQMNTAGSPDQMESVAVATFNLACEVISLFRTQWERELQSVAFGMTTADAGILMELDIHPGLSQARLAKAVGTTQMTIVRLLDRLERFGWVRRNSVSNDRRRWAISLTPAGNETIPKIYAGRRRVLDRISSHCGSFDPQLTESLSKLKESLQV